MAQLKDLIVTGPARFAGAVYGNLSGNAATATSATSATNDSAGQKINTTYIKALSISGKVITYTKGDGSTGTITTQDTNTHYTTHLYAGTSSGVANAATTNGNTYLILTDDSTARNRIKIAGSGATTVTSDANGVITISSTDTNTNTTYSAGTGLSLSGTTFNHKNSVTAATAQGDASKTLTFGGTFTIPTVTYDAQGHITAKGTTTMTMPANPNTDTHYTTHLYAGTSSGVTNAATTNGNTYLIVTDNSTARNRIKITGSGATTVTSDANGVITISSTDTNTNTWRGVQDNLTSTATDQSLSAKQGRVLKNLVDQRVKYIDLSSSVQCASFRYSVIALCSLTAVNSSNDTYSSGSIIFKRHNGLNQALRCDVTFEDQYQQDYVPQVSILSPNITAIKPCIFTYNGTKYGGIWFHYGSAEHNVVYFEGNTNFGIFGLDYYSDENGGTVLNSEVNGSLKIGYDQVHVVNNTFYINNTTVLSDSNYTSYTVKKDGTGASGSWGISVTGSAGSVAWGNVTGKPSTYNPASHTHTGDILFPHCIEFTTNSTQNHGGYIDFHYAGSTADYTSRIIELASGTLLINGVNINGGTITGSLSGNATTATKATQDSAGQQINTTYIKALSVSGKTITYTKGDGTTGTITTQDTNTWRGVQNNLTSTATDQSLSANQGRVLKGLVDGKANASHTHAYLVAGINGTSSVNTNTSTGYFQYKYNVSAGSEGLFDVSNNANAIFHFNKHNGNYDSQLGFSSNSRIYYRSCNGEALSTKSWFTLAYTSDLTWNNISGKPSSFTPASHTHNYAGSSSAGGSATSAVKLDTASAGSATQPVYWTGGKPAACSYTLGKSVPSNAVFTDTTYPVYFKNIDGNYTTAYRTQAKGNSSGGNFITVLRCDTASISGAPQYSSGIGWGRSDTHGYLCVNYGAAQAYIGGGSADKLNWVKAISLDGHTHNYAGSSSAGGDATNALKLGGLSASTSATKSTIVARDSNNYVFFNYINSNTSNSENPTISQIIVTNGSDSYYRKASLAHLKSSLGSMPASDVYAWAKASTKPTYTASEVGASAVGHGHSILTGWSDTRDKATAPNDYNGLLKVVGIKTSTLTGISDGTYSTLVGIRGWSDSSGGNAHELAFGGSGGLWHRHGSTTSWGSWTKILESSNYTDYTVTKTGSGASGTWGINVTGSAGSVAWGNVTGKPSTYTPASHTHSEYASSSHTHSGYVATSGGAMTGALKVNCSNVGTDYTTYRFRNIGFGTTSTPTSDSTYGGNGAIYFMYS